MTLQDDSKKKAFVAASTRLAKQAAYALKEYNEETAAGGEPIFPQWAADIQTILKGIK